MRDTLVTVMLLWRRDTDRRDASTCNINRGPHAGRLYKDVYNEYTGRLPFICVIVY